MHNTRYAAKRNSGGFAILEALVGLLVLAFGMVALAAFQSTLSLQSDIAKQRSEATRLAQRQIDRLRAFNQREADGTPGGTSLTYVEDVVTPADFTVTSGNTNTTFTVSTAVTVPTGDHYRWLRVAVNWLDRTGATRDVVMNTVVSDGDPGDLGALGVGRTKSTTLRPKNRNINIPYPAVTLSGGQLSAFIPPPGNVAFVFDNVTGEVVNRCTNLSVALTEGINLVGDNTIATCDATFRGYLLSGYVRFKTSGAAPTAANIDDPSDLTDPTLPLIATSSDGTTATGPTVNPLVFDASATGTGIAPIRWECYSQRQLTVRNNSAGLELSIADGATVPTGYSDSGAPRFIAYTCIVTPLDDGDPLTLNKWSGEVKLVPTTGTGAWDVETISGLYRVCRATGDYNRNGSLSNHEHPRYYRHVTGALDNQNYLVIKRSDSCPTDVNSSPLAGDFVNTNTAMHQPTVNAVPSFWCGNTGCSGPNRYEYESTLPSVAYAIPME